MLPKAIAGLKILLSGKDLELGGKKYYYQDGQLYIPGTRNGEEVILGVDMSLMEFINLCEKESDTIYLQGLRVQ